MRARALHLAAAYSAGFLLLAPFARAYNELPPANLAFFGSAATVNSGSTEYFGWASRSTSEANNEVPSAIACTATAIYVRLSAAVTGTGSSYKFTLDDNGSATSVTVAVNSGASSASASGFAVVIAAGDALDVSAAPQSSPTNAPTVTGVAVACQ
jgi:hypothetical protein